MMLCSAVPATEQSVIEIQEQARLDAKNDAGRDASKIKWGIGGFFCGVFGIAASVVYKPTVPAANFVGKCPDYILSYTKAYTPARDVWQLGVLLL